MNSDTASAGVVLVARKTIRGTAERLFDAWTQPGQLMKWWGPRSMVCSAAEVDLRVGGRYRIANQTPDGNVIWISGEFEAIERPHRLVYTWRVGAETGPSERVSVAFNPHGDSTEVIVTHERIANAAVRDRHEQGWVDCLEGLSRYLGSGR
jgi:uncharacterized protein YndB with AHSA1/START domain